ncbi:hypothetical protein [Serratia ficaria]|uniref:hypothetical protein n=1 Tax=Serratia ficaria TaxID=61651 RepID=UPI00217B4399|nr:hypothetical protein [Serratia ficaria]CAI1021660.1 Uncharacterised protein [Serratia ficaria]
MDNPILMTIIAAMILPVWFVIMSFCLWQNGFKILGWKMVLRMSCVLPVFLWIFAAFSSIYGA